MVVKVTVLAEVARFADAVVVTVVVVRLNTTVAVVALNDLGKLVAMVVTVVEVIGVLLDVRLNLTRVVRVVSIKTIVPSKPVVRDHFPGTSVAKVSAATIVFADIAEVVAVAVVMAIRHRRLVRNRRSARVVRLARVSRLGRKRWAVRTSRQIRTLWVRRS